MLNEIAVFDTTLRDGEQSAGVRFSAEDKVEIAMALAAMRVDVVEAGFPAASAGERQAVARVAREVRSTSICAAVIRNGAYVTSTTLPNERSRGGSSWWKQSACRPTTCP